MESMYLRDPPPCLTVAIRLPSELEDTLYFDPTFVGYLLAKTSVLSLSHLTINQKFQALLKTPKNS